MMRWVAEKLSVDTYVNLMDQYAPAWKVGAGRFSELDRRLSFREWEAALSAARAAGLWRFDGEKRR